MTRNFGLPTKQGANAFRRAHDAKPVSTLFVTALFGIIGAAVAVLSFREAGRYFVSIFHGPSLIAAVVAAGVGCWMYIWIARPRFAAHFRGVGDAFSDLLRFYARATLALIVIMTAGRYGGPLLGATPAAICLCAAGGAAAAAAFQTVLAFVPAYEVDS